MQKSTENMIVKILKSEMVKALGCTEPIAIAYAAATARKYLGDLPENIVVCCSGNIIKNAKAVTVPMTDNLRGIEAAAVVGTVGGDPDKKLEVLTTVTKEDLVVCKDMLARKICRVEMLDTPENLHIIVKMSDSSHKVEVELVRTHTGITKITRDGEVIYSHECQETSDGNDYSCLNIDTIYEFAATVDLKILKDTIHDQIECNEKIAEEGLRHDYGSQVGKTLLEMYGDQDIKIVAKAKPAAGSDARMNGCEMPVVINSGSGNQGMTVSLPVIEYAKKLNSSEEKLYRALVLSNLISIYLKCRIGRLSAYCGAVSAAAGAGAGITFLMDGSKKQIQDTITNTLGNISGIVCDGASSSCAAKIASSVDAAINSAYMAMNGKVFMDGEGIVKDNLQHTVDGVVEIAKDGMKTTDQVILNVMIHDDTAPCSNEK